jgi:GSH-dependent disulfide-bond oxidoreductase
MIDLYYYTSPNARKVLIALEELGLPYRIRWTDISEGDQFTEEYLKINPNAKIPAITDHEGPGGQPVTLFESAAILLYLADKTGRLMPTDPVRRWEATCWLIWQVASHGPMAGQAAHFISHAPKQGFHDEYATTRYQREITRIYQVLERRLSEEDYLAGEFSMADIACFPWVRVAAGHGIDLTDFPAISRWAGRISARASAKVRIDDPREAKAAKREYTPEQFATLFRSGPLTTGEAAPAGGPVPHDDDGGARPIATGGTRETRETRGTRGKDPG